MGDIFKGGFLGELVRNIFVVHSCVIFLSIYHKNKIVVCISLSGELVEHQGGARQKSQTEASSALLTEWTVHNNFNQFDSVTMTFSDQQTVTKLQESTNIFQKSVIGVPTSGHNDCFCSSAH